MARAKRGRNVLLLALICISTAALAAAACSPAAEGAEHLSSGCAHGNRIALTFDDGPNPPYTGQILDILSAHRAHATFFDEGQAVEADPDLVRRELAEGHAVGSHSYTHSPNFLTMAPLDFARDIALAQAALVRAAGLAPALYRSPYGHTSDSMLTELQTAGYVSIGWDLDSRDWSNATADEVVHSVLDHAHPGAIVLMHDGGLGGGNPDRSTTLAALPRILDGLAARGYQLVTIPGLTGAPERQGEKREAMCSVS